MAHKVSIVIIGRNEAAGIADCVNAALQGAEQIGGAELIFVDSSSTDNTTDIVRSLGVRVIPMPPDIRLCPSAGRFVGSQYAAGDYILFLDADTHLYKDFLPAAIAHLDNDPGLAGVNGRIDDLNENGELLDDVEDRFEDVADTKWLRGPCCFYRRSALLATGSFNPDSAMEEEAELGLRLISAGWRLNLIPLPMACHTRCYHLQTVSSLITTFKRDVVSGRLGEITRTIAYACRAGNGWAFCWLRLKTTMLFAAWLMLMLLCLALPSSLRPDVVFAFIALLGLTAIYIQKRSVKQTLVFIPNKLLVIVDVLAGLHKTRLDSRKISFRPAEHLADPN
jgi:glycosyltransferase involved in cell wall biosynthesis